MCLRQVLVPWVLLALLGAPACSDKLAAPKGGIDGSDAAGEHSKDSGSGGEPVLSQQDGAPSESAASDAADSTPLGVESDSGSLVSQVDASLSDSSFLDSGVRDTAPPWSQESSAGSGDAASPGVRSSAAYTGASSSEPVLPDSGLGPIEIRLTPPRGACALAKRVGRFIVESQLDFGVIQGTVSDGVVPATIPELVREAGSCRLNKRRTLACLPSCISGETCGEGGACIPYPERISVGQVNIRGLTREVTMKPQNPGNIYFAPGADNPPYQDLQPILLSGVGAGSVPSFELFGVGSEPLTEAPSWVLEAGVDLTIEWQAPTSLLGASVAVELTIDQHGTSPLSLTCEFDDTGSGTVPSSLVQQLIDAGISGFPNGRITRRTADHVNLPIGCVELAVGSPRAASVSVLGYTPCNGPEDCPSGKVCNTALERCE
jgi:hypothetical protein